MINLKMEFSVKRRALRTKKNASTKKQQNTELALMEFIDKKDGKKNQHKI